MFDRWIRGMKDRRAAARIHARLRRASLGQLGDVRYLGEGLHEMRIFHGPGYRLYYVYRDDAVVLLCGGTKSSQRRDMERAFKLARELEA